MQSKLTYTKMTQKNTYFLLHGAPYKSNISSWQPPRYCSEFIFLQIETGCQLVPKMFSVTFLSGFCPQTTCRSRIVFAKPEDLETWSNHLSFRFLTRFRSSSYSPMAPWIFLRTSSLVTWSLYEMFNSLNCYNECHYKKGSLY